MKDENIETMKNAGDALSVFTVVGTLIEMLPSIAAIFTIIWTGIRIYETDTVKGVVSKVIDWVNKIRRKDG